MSAKLPTGNEVGVRPLDLQMIGRLVAVESTCSLILKLITGGNKDVLDTQLDRLVVAWACALETSRAMKPERAALYLAYEAQITQTLASIFADAKREPNPSTKGTDASATSPRD